MSNKWLPIETAPTKAGTRILLYFPAIKNLTIEIMVSQTIGDEEVIWKSDNGQIHTATHWMPLPKPPKQ